VRWQNRNGADAIRAFDGALAQTFVPAHPNITVSVEPAPDNRDQKLLTQMAAGDAPDVFETWNNNVEQYAEKAQVLDVAPLVDQSKLDVSDFYAWQWRDFNLPVLGGPSEGGTLIRFGLPKYVNIMVVWVNQDMFQQKGVELPSLSWTHDDYTSAMAKLTVLDGSTLKVAGAYLTIGGLARAWYHIYMWGGSDVDPNDDTKCDLDQKPAQDALEWARHLAWDTRTMVINASLMPTVQGDRFFAGQFGMQEDGFYPFQMAQNNSKVKINWQYAHVPQGPVDRKVLGTTDGFAIWKGSKHVPEAWQLLQYLAGPDFQTAQCEVTGLLPVRTSVLAKWRSICIQKYPELAEINLDVGPQAMQLGYPGNRRIFHDDTDGVTMVNDGLTKLFSKPGTPTSSMQAVAQQVTQFERGKAGGTPQPG